MHCQHLAAVLAKRVKRFSPLGSPLQRLAFGTAHGTYGFTVGQHGIGKNSDKVVPFRTMHGFYNTSIFPSLNTSIFPSLALVGVDRIRKDRRNRQAEPLGGTACPTTQNRTFQSQVDEIAGEIAERRGAAWLSMHC